MAALQPVKAFPIGDLPQTPPLLRSYEGGFIERVGLLRETGLQTPLEEMRRRLERDGYVFVKGLIPREDVLQMREQ